MGVNMGAVEYLTTEELAARWKMHPQSIHNWRAQTPAKGPAFVKIGKKVLYPLDSIVQWEQQRLQAVNDNGGGERGK